MKQIVVHGNIGRNAEVRYTQAGDSVTSWSLAVEERNGKDKRTLWFDCSLWGKRGEALAPYLTKGSRVVVAGDLSTREHEGKTYLTVRVDQVSLGGGGERRDGENTSPSTQARRTDSYQAPPKARVDLDDSIPF